ncbi:lipid droplet-associated protein [Actinophytocola sp.]|uniref:lipid droplet-associated protein n=1 Tax=Actinophytocola sp. TaxID=1872138 RepID=UPI002ED17611
MKSLPLPIRVAAGLAVTAVEQARTLPAKLAGLPVTVASQALQVSMRVQQQVTELAIRGDEVLASFRPVEDTPEWATFDEDVEDEGFDSKPTPFESAFDRVADEPVRRNGHSAETFATPDPWAQEERAFAQETGFFDDSEQAEDESEDVGHEGAPGGNGSLEEVTGSDRTLSVVAGDDQDVPKKDERSVPDGAGLGDDLSVAADAPADVVAAEPDVDGGGALAELGDVTAGDSPPLSEAAGYDELSLPQLRARLRRFSADELSELLDYERAHENRPSFVGMLTRRIAAVRDQR